MAEAKSIADTIGGLFSHDEAKKDPNHEVESCPTCNKPSEPESGQGKAFKSIRGAFGNS